ncbi:ABC-2 family transporter protein [Brucepastera parasyntrophica]|uniref:ABC transporter permease n=1 Tax=Brucepastera parasyntrophica TaxID=2880008 RepID=UPI00210A5A50|nr:ABC-2 family transporter protein [Brucepastera parasyntrophica]ULQ59587.1 ABC-2 family transporter protein [Brucepastera parasyntrophica]
MKKLYAGICRFLCLYKAFTAQFIKRLAEYRGDFLIGTVAFLLRQILNLVFIFLIFSNITELQGWNLQQIIFIYGFSQIPRGIDHLYADNLWKVSYFLVRNGNFDKYLLRPINPLFHVFLEGFEPDALAELLSGIILIIVSSANLSLRLNGVQIVLGIAAIAGGTMIYTGIKIAFAAIALKTKRSGSLLHMVYMTSDFSKYPVTIYNEVIKTIITYIIPFAFTAYYPASYLLTGENSLFCIGGTIAAGALWIIIGLLAWKKGLSVYESAGN